MTFAITPEDYDRDGPILGIERLQAALEHVLGEGFEEHVRAAIEGRSWYHEYLPCSEAFRLWICDNLERGEDPEWVFQPLRAGERKFLCDALEIPRERIVGKGPRELASLVMGATGLPGSDVSGVASLRTSWQEIHSLGSNDEDERAAVLCRQRGERFLREMLIFYCGLEYGEYFSAMLQEPGNLRVPEKLRRCLAGGSTEERSGKLIEAFLDENVGDLGFFSIALRKFSSRVESGGESHICGDHLLIFSEAEFQAFNSLGTSLQAYHHDKPSRMARRREELISAVDSILASLETMAGRRVIPEEMFVIEASCRTPFGRSFRGLAGSGKIRCLTADSSPQHGEKIRFITAADRDYSRCLWRRSPWAGAGG